MGLVMAGVVAPASVLLFWRIRPNDHTCGRADTARPFRWWTPALGAALYVGLYLAFGYFVAWRSPAVRAYYGGDASTGFLSHLIALQSRAPWFLPFQFLRGCLWVALGALTLSLVSGSWIRRGVVLGTFFAVMMNAQLLFPNEAMPDAVRAMHIAETAPCNFIFGAVLAAMLRRREACR